MAPHRRRNRAAEQGANFINVTLIRRSWLALSFALWAVAGCNAIELVSERAFEEKVQSLRIGQANLAEIEALFGTAHVVERNPLTYNFADTEFGASVRRYTPPSGALPITAGAFPSNTRGGINVGFDGAVNQQQGAVERYFDPPFINDYTYSIKDTAKDPLDAVGQIAAANGFKSVDRSKETGTIILLDNESKALTSVKLIGRILRLTSKNPHSRISNEHLYSRRESNLTSAITSADWVSNSTGHERTQLSSHRGSTTLEPQIKLLEIVKPGSQRSDFANLFAGVLVLPWTAPLQLERFQ